MKSEQEISAAASDPTCTTNGGSFKRPIDVTQDRVEPAALKRLTELCAALAVDHCHRPLQQDPQHTEDLLQDMIPLSTHKYQSLLFECPCVGDQALMYKIIQYVYALLYLIMEA